MKILVYIIFGVDQLIYKTIGWASPIRKAYWRRKAIQIQYELDTQHNIGFGVNNEL